MLRLEVGRVRIAVSVRVPSCDRDVYCCHGPLLLMK
jgi:hypothetical protein